MTDWWGKSQANSPGSRAEMGQFCSAADAILPQPHQLTFCDRPRSPRKSSRPLGTELGPNSADRAAGLQFYVDLSDFAPRVCVEREEKKRRVREGDKERERELGNFGATLFHRAH